MDPDLAFPAMLPLCGASRPHSFNLARQHINRHARRCPTLVAFAMAMKLYELSHKLSVEIDDVQGGRLAQLVQQFVRWPELLIS